MNHRRCSTLVISTVLPIILYGAAGVALGKSEIKGAAILENPCGKVAVKQMGLVHAGNMDEANKLSTKEMQDQWKAMPAKDRTMMSGMMKEMSQTEAQYAADIKANGVLVVDVRLQTVFFEHLQLGIRLGQVGLVDHITIGDGAMIGAQSGVFENVPAGAKWFGYPAAPSRDFMRSVFTLRKLSASTKKVEK